MSAVKIAGIAVKTATIEELAHERLVSIGAGLLSRYSRSEEKCAEPSLLL